jgi:hypothetical protein
MMDSTRYLSFAGRLLIGLPFAMGGLSKLAAYGLPRRSLQLACQCRRSPLRSSLSSAVGFC